MTAKLWAIVRREYVERVRTKGFVIGTVLGVLGGGTVARDKCPTPRGDVMASRYVTSPNLSS